MFKKVMKKTAFAVAKKVAAEHKIDSVYDILSTESKSIRDVAARKELARQLMAEPFNWTPILLDLLWGGKLKNPARRTKAWASEVINVPKWDQTPRQVALSMGGYPKGRAKRDVVRKQQVMVEIVRRCPGVSLQQVADACGLKDHTSAWRMLTNYEIDTGERLLRNMLNEGRGGDGLTSKGTPTSDNPSPTRRPEPKPITSLALDI